MHGLYRGSGPSLGSGGDMSSQYYLNNIQITQHNGVVEEGEFYCISRSCNSVPETGSKFCMVHRLCPVAGGTLQAGSNTYIL